MQDILISLLDAALESDVRYIVKIFVSGANVEMDPRLLQVPPSSYESSEFLYSQIVKKIRGYGFQNELTDMMPIIDEYLEFQS